LGFEFSMPIGFRAARSQVRNLELQLAKGRAILAAQELEISHELAHAFRELDRFYQTAATNFNRRRFAEQRVRAYEAQFEAGRTNIDLVLRSQISLAQAEIAFYTSLIEYNKAITNAHYRKGTLLEHNQVYLAESGWTPEAYRDALERAWARTYAIGAERCLETQPPEFATNRVSVEGLAHPPAEAPEPAPLTPVPEAGDYEGEAAPADVPPPPETSQLVPEATDELSEAQFEQQVTTESEPAGVATLEQLGEEGAAADNAAPTSEVTDSLEPTADVAEEPETETPPVIVPAQRRKFPLPRQ
jgi:hypothetical protein